MPIIPFLTIGLWRKQTNKLPCLGLHAREILFPHIGDYNEDSVSEFLEKSHYSWPKHQEKPGAEPCTLPVETLGPTDLQDSQIWDPIISIIFQLLLEHFVFLLFGDVIYIQHHLAWLGLCGYLAEIIIGLLTAGLLHTARQFVSSVNTVFVAALGPGRSEGMLLSLSPS